MNNKVTIISEEKPRLLDKFPRYSPFSDNQFIDACKLASQNPSRFIVSIDDKVDFREFSFTSMYDLTGLRIGWIDTTMNIQTFDLIRQELISLQQKYINNEIDVIVLSYSYNDMFADIKNTSIVRRTGKLISDWKKQTEQLAGVQIPVIVQIKRLQTYSRLTKLEEEEIDFILLNELE